MNLIFLFGCGTFIVITIRLTYELLGEVELKEKANADYQAWELDF